MSEYETEQPQDGSESPAEAPVDPDALIVPEGAPPWLREALERFHNRIRRVEGR